MNRSPPVVPHDAELQRRYGDLMRPASAVQEPHVARHARDLHRPGSRIPIPRGRLEPRRWGRGRCCRSCRRWPTRCSTPWACGSTRSRSRRKSIVTALEAGSRGRAPRCGPSAFPVIAWPETLCQGGSCWGSRGPGFDSADSVTSGPANASYRRVPESGSAHRPCAGIDHRRPQRGRAVGAPHVPARHPAMIPCTCVLPGL